MVPEDCQSNFGVRRYSDIGGGGVIAVAIHGWSEDCQSNSGVRGYSDIWGVCSNGYPWMVTPVYRDTLT